MVSIETIIGYKLKKECEQYKSQAEEIAGLQFDNRSFCTDFKALSCAHANIDKAGLSHWFTPVLAPGKCIGFMLKLEYPNCTKKKGDTVPYTTGEFLHYPEIWEPVYKKKGVSKEVDFTQSPKCMGSFQ